MQQEFEAIHGFHPSTSILIGKLKAGKEGDEFTDEQLTELTGEDHRPDGNGYGHIQSAIKYVERMGLVWRRLREGGVIRCLGDAEKVEMGLRDRKRLHRAATRSVRRIRSINLQNLTEEQKSQALVCGAQLATLAMLTKPSTTKQLAATDIKYQPTVDDIKNLMANR